MKNSKYHIYTIAPKKGFGLLFFAFLVISFFVLTFKLMINPYKKSFDFVMKKSINSVFMKRDKDSLPHPDVFNLKIHNVMNQLSPVFANSKNSVALHEGKKEPTVQAETVKAREEVQKVNAKSFFSTAATIKNETNYTPDTEKLLAEPRTYSAKGSEPKVLIVHTHGCETYSDSKGFGLGENKEYRTTDTNINMVKIGEAMADVFRQKGIGVIHDKTLCDYPKYNSSYVKSLEVIENNLLKYPNIEFVFDIHRDAIASQDGTPTKLVCTVNGKSTAQAMIVCGTDAMGLENPNWQENLILALKIQKNLETRCPGLMRPINLRKERFNMHKTKGSLLFEVGTHGNTLEEALNGAKLLAEGIAETIAR